MIKRGLICVCLLLGFMSTRALSAELVMVHSLYCDWCERWEEEVGAVYPRTPEAEILPLRRVDIGELAMSGVPISTPVYYTPTFIVVADGREAGRIQGYPGAAFFWGLLQDIIVSRNLQ